MCHMSGVDSINLSSSMGPMLTHGMMSLEENQVDKKSKEPMMA